ncbi:hypothetical protein UFOVP1219_27 [uncultured Caudovirales phage]|uniref:Uncharacterized protein n=1 Tax=uncultured Caudovirales phage TaxID=2100421 RepID=A0A6J5MH20_9CAUD|nr:hypothetical protein UFOVP476_73 [uncultured Caudovirales phage]CAB4176018.1 hypothetical protein UFOVP986_2 [uncultured Caudovirales phage]CAB4191146.1 hypothetical protein UFOVP1219_27 [uncultured Caudovirales phage]CAB4223090.1 hypothetical protein UFOVP1671_2 [uncultured Caudovirales phage]CAB5220511.1 hypothetical protein UFOVP358_31 [uncultured Caudovirales phage]
MFSVEAGVWGQPTSNDISSKKNAFKKIDEILASGTHEVLCGQLWKYDTTSTFKPNNQDVAEYFAFVAKEVK